MARWLILLLCIPLQGCFVEAPGGAGAVSTGSNSGSSGGGESSSALSADVRLMTNGDANGDFPLGIKATITATAGSTYTLKLGDDVIESGAMPTNALLQGPASGITDGNNKRLVYFVIPQSGTQQVSLTIAKGGLTATDSETISIASNCESNDSFYINEELADNFSCGGCHEAGGTASFIIDGSSLATISNVPKFNGSDPYVLANTPANLDRTPGANTFGGEYSHSGGVRWSPDSVAHFRTLELAYRVRNDFTCPL